LTHWENIVDPEAKIDRSRAVLAVVELSDRLHVVGAKLHYLWKSSNGAALNGV
jgi:hypothetical protein